MADENSVSREMEDDLNSSAKSVLHATETIGKGIKTASQIAAKTAGSAAAGSAGSAAASTAGAAGSATAGAAGGTAAGTAGGAAAGAAGTAAGTAGGAAGGAAVGTAAGPVGAIVGAVVGLAIQAVKSIKKASDISIDAEDENAPKLNMFPLISLGFVLFINVFCGTLLSKGTASVLSVNQETEFQNTRYGGGNMSQAGERFKEDSSSALDNYNDSYPLSNAIMDYIWGNATHKGFRNVCMEAINENLANTVLSLEQTLPDKTWDGNRTMTYFYDLPFPYDLQKSSDRIYPAIGDVLHPDPGGEYEIDDYDGQYLARFDDVNWAEVITILSQNVSSDESHQYALNWGECNYEDFQKFIETDRCKDYMYELGVKWIPIYTGTKKVQNQDGTYTEIEVTGDGAEYDDPQSCSAAPQTMEVDGVECTFTGFWNKTDVKPFGLRELYALADVTPENKHVEFTNHTNYEMLDYTERVTRLYTRGMNVTFKSGGSIDQLGPSYSKKRSELSTIYDELNSDPVLIAEGKAGQGRSCWCYIENTYDRNLSQIDYRNERPPYESATPPRSVQISGSLAEKLAYYFPDGVPTSAEEMQQYLTTISVKCRNSKGEDVTYNLTVHEKVAPSLEVGLQALYDSGYAIDSIGGYSWRAMVAGGGKRSMHSYGLAVDINPSANPFYKNGHVYAGTEWNPNTNPLSISQETADKMIENGWYWGGNWNSSKDYMHFSVTGY